MSKTLSKTLYDKLLPKVKDALRKNAKEYDSAKRFKYNLMSKSNWWDLNIEEIKLNLNKQIGELKTPTTKSYNNPFE